MHSWVPTPAVVLLEPHSWGPKVLARSSLMGPPPRSSRGREDLGGRGLGFPRTALQPSMGASKAAAALSRSRKALGTWAEGCPVVVFPAPLQSPRSGRGYCPSRGLVPRAPAPRPRPTAGGSRATCPVWVQGWAAPPRPPPAWPLLEPTRALPPLAASGALSVPVPASPGRPTSQGLATPAPSAFPGHVARAPAGIPWAPPGGGGPVAPSGDAGDPAFVRRHTHIHTHPPEGQPRWLLASLYCT